MSFSYQNIRPYTGGIIATASSLESITQGNDHDFLDITGIGTLDHFTVYVASHFDSHLAKVILTIDGDIIYPSNTFQAFNALGYDTSSEFIQLRQYAADGQIYCIFKYPLNYNKSLKINVLNTSAAQTLQVLVEYLYFAIN